MLEHRFFNKLLDLDTYCQFAMIHPDSLDAEGLAQIPDVILANTKWVQ
jgi:hypothetical protein